MLVLREKGEVVIDLDLALARARKGGVFWSPSTRSAVTGSSVRGLSFCHSRKLTDHRMTVQTSEPHYRPNVFLFSTLGGYFWVVHPPNPLRPARPKGHGPHWDHADSNRTWGTFVTFSNWSLVPPIPAEALYRLNLGEGFQKSLCCLVCFRCFDRGKRKGKQYNDGFVMPYYR